MRVLARFMNQNIRFMVLDDKGKLHGREYHPFSAAMQDKTMWPLYSYLTTMIPNFAEVQHDNFHVLFGVFDRGCYSHMERHLDGFACVDMDVADEHQFANLLKKLV